MSATLLMALLPVLAAAQSIVPGRMQPAYPLPVKAASPHPAVLTSVRPVLHNVSILRGKSSLEVHIEASGPVQPELMLLSNPERIVVDLPGVSCGGGHRLPVKIGGIDGVRVGLFQGDPPITRVVVDLKQPHGYRLMPAGSMVILAVDYGEKLADTAPPAGPRVATLSNASMPVAREPVPAKPARAVTPTPAPQSVASAPPPSKEVVPAGAPQPPASVIMPASAVPALQASVVKPPAPPSVPAETEPPLATDDEGETTSHQAAKQGNKPAWLETMTVSREKEGIALRIEASKPLRASATAFSNPERIVLDLANVRLAHARHIAVNAADVQDVSASLFLVNPLVTRVVVDLAHPHGYHVETSGNTLTLWIDTEPVKAAGSQPGR